MNQLVPHKESGFISHLVLAGLRWGWFLHFQLLRMSSAYALQLALALKSPVTVGHASIGLIEALITDVESSDQAESP